MWARDDSQRGVDPVMNHRVGSAVILRGVYTLLGTAIIPRGCRLYYESSLGHALIPKGVYTILEVIARTRDDFQRGVDLVMNGRVGTR